jgi:hypothetical protein
VNPLPPPPEKGPPSKPPAPDKRPPTPEPDPNPDSDVEMANPNSGKEIRLNLPKVFDGNRENLTPFLQDCQVYLTLNDHIYDTDEKKIAFFLSFLTEGVAKVWKEGYLLDKLGKGFGSLTTFKKLLQDTFSASDVEGDARAKLRQLKQGKDTADEYVSQFRILAGRSKIKEDSSLIEYFMEGLNNGILQKIFTLEKMPTTIDKWYELASRFDAQHRRVQEIIGRRRGTAINTNTNQRKTYVPRYASHNDPNAMDIDRLTIEQRDKHIRENRCFNCHRIGHRIKDCRSPKQQEPTQNQDVTNKFQGIKKTATTARAMIRNLVADMDEEEKDKLFKEISTDQDF